MMINIAKLVLKDSSWDSIKPTSGELALCANYPCSIPVSPAAPEMAS